MYFDEEKKADICREEKVDSDYLRVLLHRAKGRFRKAYYVPKGDNGKVN
jgi:hypothetical protein